MPSWRPDTAKQRVWLGPDRHRCRCRDTVTNSEPKSYANSNRYPVCMRTDAIANTYRLTNSDGNSHGYSNANRYSDPKRDCNSHSYGYFHTKANAYAEIFAHSQTASHTAAETVVVFAKANIVVIGDIW